MNPTNPLRLPVPELHEGSRLDRFLAEMAPQHSRTRWARAIEAGGVRVDGAVATASLKLHAGQQVEAEIPQAPPSTVEPEDLELNVLYEDAVLAVIDKPAGLTVHPGAGRRGGTLANALVHRYRGLPEALGSDRPGIVHRLDKDTSGLLLVAREERTHRALSRMLAERRIRREYWGMVWGELPEQGRIEAPIGRDPHSRVRMAVVQGARASATGYWRLESLGFASEARFQLESGRTHQIRVHLAHVRHPVVGDPVYGGMEARGAGVPPEARPVLEAAARRLGRQALHAWRLGFEHPASGAIMKFESPLPTDLEALREAFRARTLK